MTEVSEIQNDQTFSMKRTDYCRRFATSHLSSFRPHYKKGETLGKSPEDWRNVSEHCLVAGIFADILCEELRVNPEEREKIVNAALLHDWFKKHEATGIEINLSKGLTNIQLEGEQNSG